MISGKTTLIVELIELLTQRGLKIGTINHTGYSYELDTPGKDSHRHRQAGSVPAAIIAGPLMGIYLPADKP
ncbi:MAG: molybdopterin-guanine dinucleotide biosynthesis protein B, partial [Delftia sp.]|nr:molybdopterin-guanine dinucleotide biosynthesis protein B [Delftia sp.]